ncbi:MAG: DNA polymerase Y family protein [Cucumibacter sp.]
MVLYEMEKSAMRLMALNRAALSAGLGEGQTLADARALCPPLLARPMDRARLMAAFEELADWLSWASPLVAVHRAMTPMSDIVFDVTGVAHLWGGEQALLDALTTRLAGLGLEARGSIAPTIGAAWALSHYGEDGIITSPRKGGGGVDTQTTPTPTLPLTRGGGVAEALACLPVMALRLDEATGDGLDRMGLKRIGQLYGRDRRALQARFGEGLLLRLDQALGTRNERIVPRLPEPERMAERRFGEPIALLDDVMATVADLSIRLTAGLEAGREGAQTFHLFLYRVDHKVMHLAVNAASATRDGKHVTRLFANRLERFEGEFDTGFGIDMVRLGATSVSRLEAAQLGVFEGADARLGLDRLYDRVTSRLGAAALTRSKFADTHIPERAVMLEPVVASTDAVPGAAPDPALPRPLRLLPVPEEIAVIAEVPEGPPARMEWRRVSHRFRRASGPERIGVEWWRPGEGSLTRDYYIAEDEEGRRFWLFREGLYGEAPAKPRWFLHGLFA